jgi:hypothetical protein
MRPTLVVSHGSAGRNSAPSSSVDARVRFAIEHKRLLRLVYLGKARVVEPHDYGLQKGTPKLLVYQRYEIATSRQRQAPVWRTLEVPKFESCEVLEDTFPGSRRTSNQRHHTWDALYARVK